MLVPKESKPPLPHRMRTGLYATDEETKQFLLLQVVKDGRESKKRYQRQKEGPQWTTSPSQLLWALQSSIENGWLLYSSSSASGHCLSHHLPGQVSPNWQRILYSRTDSFQVLLPSSQSSLIQNTFCWAPTRCQAPWEGRGTKVRIYSLPHSACLLSGMHRVTVNSEDSANYTNLWHLPKMKRCENKIGFQFAGYHSRGFFLVDVPYGNNNSLHLYKALEFTMSSHKHDLIVKYWDSAFLSQFTDDKIEANKK